MDGWTGEAAASTFELREREDERRVVGLVVSVWALFFEERECVPFALLTIT